MLLPVVVSQAAPFAVYWVMQVSHACVVTLGGALQ
jgi:hypothetical protein